MPKVYLPIINNLCLFIIIWMGAVSPSLAQSKINTSIKAVTYFLSDDSATSIDEIVKLDSGWQPQPNASANFGFTGATVWVKIELYNPSETIEDLYLQVRWPLLTKAQAYVTNGQDVVKAKDIRYRVPMYHLSIGPKMKRTVYIEAASNALLILPIKLANADDFLKDVMPELVIMYGAFGLFVTVILYNGFLGLGTRESVYQYYVLYFAAAFCWISVITGLAFQWGYDRSGVVGTHGFVVSVCLAQAAGGLFCIKFLNLEQAFSKLYTLIKYCCIAWLCLLVLSIWLPISTLRFIGAPLSLVLCSSALFAGLFLWRKGHVFGKYFTIAWLLLIVTVVDYSLAWIGFEYNEFRHTWLLVLGASVEAVLLSLGLAERINEQKREKTRLQEALISHQEKANRELEKKVKDRTESLQIALKDLEKANSELAHLTETDQLTGVKNRRYFDNKLIEEIKRSQRDKQPLALIILDIDHFKQFNDVHGHLVGDACLQHVAKTIEKEISRSGDVFARYGGEEFAVVLHNTDDTGCRVVADRVREAIDRSSFVSEGKIIPVTASFGGVSMIANDNTSPLALIELADSALYEAKEAGRNCVKLSASQR